MIQYKSYEILSNENSHCTGGSCCNRGRHTIFGIYQKIMNCVMRSDTPPDIISFEMWPCWKLSVHLRDSPMKKSFIIKLCLHIPSTRGWMFIFGNLYCKILAVIKNMWRHESRMRPKSNPWEFTWNSINFRCYSSFSWIH